MKSKDLRIGNKVRVSIFESEKDFKDNVKDTYINQEWFIGNIESIEPFNPDYTYNIELDTKEKHANNIEEWERVEPIPLTEEWLSKTDCIINDTFLAKYFNYEYSTISLTKCNDKGKGEYYVMIRQEDEIISLPNRMFYVHEWQNLYFALTGKELVFSEA